LLTLSAAITCRQLVYAAELSYAGYAITPPEASGRAGWLAFAIRHIYATLSDTS